MELTVGAILEGKVKTITNFGAFVALPENKTGVVHISDVANTFVHQAAGGQASAGERTPE